MFFAVTSVSRAPIVVACAPTRARALAEGRLEIERRYGPLTSLWAQTAHKNLHVASESALRREGWNIEWVYETLAHPFV